MTEVDSSGLLILIQGYDAHLRQLPEPPKDLRNLIQNANYMAWEGRAVRLMLVLHGHLTTEISGSPPLVNHLTQNEKTLLEALTKKLESHVRNVPGTKSQDRLEWVRVGQGLVAELREIVTNLPLSTEVRGDPQDVVPEEAVSESPPEEVTPPLPDPKPDPKPGPAPVGTPAIVSEAVEEPPKDESNTSQRTAASDEDSKAPIAPRQAFMLLERTRVQEDEEKLRAMVEEWEPWHQRLADAKIRVAAAVSLAQLVLSTLEPQSDNASDTLKSRYRSLEVLGKMIAKLGEKAEALVPPEKVVALFPSPSELPEAEPEDGLERRLDEYAERESQARYDVITEVRRAGEAARKAFMGLIEKHVFPVSDAIDDGVRYSLELDLPEEKESVGKIADIYSKIQLVFLNAFSEIGIDLMTVNVGEMIDYRLHEPFDIEVDPTMPDESVKEIFRKGYLLDTDFVLRPAQVVVVRNS